MKVNSAVSDELFTDPCRPHSMIAIALLLLGGLLVWIGCGDSNAAHVEPMTQRRTRAAGGNDASSRAKRNPSRRASPRGWRVGDWNRSRISSRAHHRRDPGQGHRPASSSRVHELEAKAMS